MFGNLPFIIEMQDQEAIDIMNNIDNYIPSYDSQARRAQLSHEFDMAGLEIEMLSPRVQEMVQTFCWEY